MKDIIDILIFAREESGSFTGQGLSTVVKLDFVLGDLINSMSITDSLTCQFQCIGSGKNSVSVLALANLTEFT